MIFPWINYLEVYKELSMNNEPPTLYSFMQSIVNYNRQPDDQVKIKDLAQYSRETIFDFDYPISDSFGKEAFEIMFLNHYMFRRINYDTLRSFQLHLMVKLNDIMPKYNKMIEGFNKIAFDGTVEVHTRNLTDNKAGTSTTSSQATDNSTNDNRYSDTPQGDLTSVQDGTYLTDYTYNQVNGTSNSSSNSSNTSNSNVSEDITIKKGDSIDEYKKYLDLLNNIYSMIFKECDSLFYGII